MAAIRHTLQKSVFLPSDERLIGVVHVTKVAKKKKQSFLCAAVSTDKPPVAAVYTVKKSDKGDTYKKQKSWMLTALKKVDGKDAGKEVVEFDLHFEKIYRWAASSVQEKNAFVSCLYKLVTRYLPHHQIEFENVQQDLLIDASLQEDTTSSAPTDSLDMQDYQALSAREEADVKKLMAECDSSVTNAEQFVEQLVKDLSVLDEANLHSLMASEQQVTELMNLLEHGITEAERIEQRLDKYDLLLQGVKDYMETVTEKDTMITVHTSNKSKLTDCLEDLINKLDIPHNDQMTLMDGDLTKQHGIRKCVAATKVLDQAMNAELDPGLERMRAVQEQQKLFDKLLHTFAKRFSHQMNNLFIHLCNEHESMAHQSLVLYTESGGGHGLQSHVKIHRELQPYAELMTWLKKSEHNSYKHLVKMYTSSFSKSYEKEIRQFMEQYKSSPQSRPLERKSNTLGAGLSSLSSAAQDIARVRSNASLLSMEGVDSGSEIDLAERSKFDLALEHILSELEPICLSEQQFCVEFFNLPEIAEENPEDTPQKRLNKTEEMRKTMHDLFPNLESDLYRYLDDCCKVDGFYSLYMLVRVNQHVVSTQESGSFLGKILAACQLQAKRNFDKFMSNQQRAIEEARAVKSKKCGILPFVHNFGDFAEQAENIFRASERYSDLEKWYSRLIGTMFDAIVRIAGEHLKTPVEVVQFENFHHLNSTLSRLKIPCLENEKKETKRLCNEQIAAYVTTYLGRPLEKLNNFFEGVQAVVARGVKEEEVGYQLSYSKTELRKVIKEYPGKEVKKGLEHLYKKVDKHLCEEENLLQVVWRDMQEEFIRQYKSFEDLIARCYPGANITLEFTIKDILEYFSNIAQQH